MVSVLVKIFGTEHIELAEDVVQDALMKALETWKYRGMPDNPRAWLYRTAKNKAIDIIRRQKHSRSFDFADPTRQLLNSEYTLVSTMNTLWQNDHIQDDFLGMMYACCHPDISPDHQITLILKSLCGFSTKEVARAFLVPVDTISKRLYRTKEFFRNNKIRPEIPSSDEVASRSDSVLAAIYLMFNEGHQSTHHDAAIRTDLIGQAMHLCQSLLANERTRLPEVYALQALMCFHAARATSRLSIEGEIILLVDQDRKLWSPELIQQGIKYLNESSTGQTISQFHLEAAIAYEHCVAPTYQQTNWQQINLYYDQMLLQSFDPVVLLNKCIALWQLSGAEIALETLTKQHTDQLNSYYLYHAVLGDLLSQLGRPKQAVRAFRRARALTQSDLEKKLLDRKMQREVD